ncbi:peptidase [Laribacter hongkongensis]|uniref:peptidase n=1 Tax=Laribacter hongkongensis TaxID=168471 RepID=UPI001EFC4B05|nr:peptidase [Laribacter hongkongensis]MCG9051577.1 peptidase [Laribacter hongkongensis]
MTYCVALNLDAGLVFAADTRTNAGVDHIASFRKLTVLVATQERTVVVLNAGNLATTQSVLNLARRRQDEGGQHVGNHSCFYDIAGELGQTLREVIRQESGGQNCGSGIDFGASLIVGGQIAGDIPRLFHVYPQGNFIESSPDTPYFQIGEAKYGKPILDRVITLATPLAEALKCVLISFDSTIRSNLSVGLPIDTLVLPRDSRQPVQQRIDAEQPYYRQLRRQWGEGLRRVFGELDDADWMRGL